MSIAGDLSTAAAWSVGGARLAKSHPHSVRLRRKKRSKLCIRWRLSSSNGMELRLLTTLEKVRTGPVRPTSIFVSVPSFPLHLASPLCFRPLGPACSRSGQEASVCKAHTRKASHTLPCSPRMHFRQLFVRQPRRFSVCYRASLASKSPCDCLHEGSDRRSSSSCPAPVAARLRMPVCWRSGPG